MRKFKKGLYLFLAAVVTLSAISAFAFAADAPPIVNNVSNSSLHRDLDLTSYTEAELKAVPISVMLDKMGISLTGGQKLIWGYWVEEREYYSGYFDLRVFDDTYRIVDPSLTVDMRSEYYNDNFTFYFGIGSGKALDKNTTWYCVNASITNMPSSYDIKPTLYSNDEPRKKVYKVFDEEGSRYGASEEDGVWTYYLQIPTIYPIENQYYLGLFENEGNRFNGLTVSVYKGHLAPDNLNPDALVSDLWAKDISASGGHLAVYSDTAQDFTLVFSKAGKIHKAQKISIIARPMTSQLENLSSPKTDSYDKDYWSSVYRYSSDSDRYYMYLSDIWGYDEDIGSFFTANKTLRFRMVSGVTGLLDNSLITSVTVNSADVTAQAVGGNYTIDRTKDVSVKVVADGTTYNITIPAFAQDAADDWQEIGSQDTYFGITGAKDIYDYVVPYKHDTYYYNGYQTVFIIDGDTKLAALRPTFYTGNTVKAYVGVEQTSGETTQDFSEGPVQYTAKAEDNATVRNYTVMFIEKDESGASLFVNGPNERFIAFDDYYGFKHDIIIANLGTAPLQGLNVTLTNATNVKLDEWYTMDGTLPLDAFTDASKYNEDYYGEPSNVAKIRLTPNGEGQIAGTLTISSTNGATKTITLSGRAGNPSINTKQASINEHPAVKFVPYSFLVTTDNPYTWCNVVFSKTGGTLPNGMVFRPNGEIYGVPTETGTFTFAVQAVFESNRQQFPLVTAEFTLTVIENTNENVNAQNDYTLMSRVPDMTSYQDQLFQIDNDFIDWTGKFFLNGVELVDGTDYDAVEGSTKITIRAQTFRDTGAGTHTIAAEFRNDGGTGIVMTKGTQNYNAGGSQPTQPPRPSPAAPPVPAPGSTANLITTEGINTIIPPNPTAGQDLAYTVQPGETLWGIAFNYYGSMQRTVVGRIYAANADYFRRTNGVLETGAVITLPARGLVNPVTQGSLDKAVGVYLVKSGDTLSSLAKFYYGDPLAWGKLYDANRDRVRLYTGGVAMIYEKQWLVIVE